MLNMKREAASAAASPYIKDVTTATFRQEVIAESMNQPVLVDFWAPWCGPCKQLTPVLEKVVNAAKGKIKLVKMNIDTDPQIAGQLGVQSIPAVFAFDRGQPIDGFMGALPESQVKAFIERLIGPDEEAAIAALIEEGKALLEAGDVGSASALFAQILAQEPEQPEALAGLAKAQILAGNLEAANGILTNVPANLSSHLAITAARAALELAQQAASLGDVSALIKAVEADATNHQARFDLALALNAHHKREEAVDHLLIILKKDRSWNEDGARKQLLTFFEAWGSEEEATRSGRRKLSAALFA